MRFNDLINTPINKIGLFTELSEDSNRFDRDFEEDDDERDNLGGNSDSMRNVNDDERDNRVMYSDSMRAVNDDVNEVLDTFSFNNETKPSGFPIKELSPEYKWNRDEDDEDGDEDCDDEDCDDEDCDDDSTELTPKQEENVDNKIKLIATPILLDDTLDETEINSFKESTESDAAINEGYFTERTIVKMDKVAKKARLRKIAAFAIAKEKKDPLFKKLNIVWKMERKLEAAIMKKYSAPAEVRVRKYLANANKSPVKVIRNLASKMLPGKSTK